jgi:hypothetical protein
MTVIRVPTEEVAALHSKIADPHLARLPIEDRFAFHQV